MSRRVAVLGLGYVGLPLVRACVANGHSVVGFDISEPVVGGLASGESHVDDTTNDEVAKWLIKGFHPTTRSDDLTDIEVFVICVPTPLSESGGPDLEAVMAAAETIARNLTPGALVILESTSYPGTTDEVVRPILEQSGLVAGSDFALAFSPERIDPGNQEFTFENTPKVVGGLTPSCRDAASDFYSPLVTEVVMVKGLREAEMAKLLENTYRHVNIALVNELAKLSHEMGIDIWDVIRAAETKPYGFQAFRPGPGVGGHCIPIDPNYLSHRVKSELHQPFRFVELAQEINDSMPNYVVHRVQELLNRQGRAVMGATVLLLGITYKRNIADMRETPAVAVVRGLRRLGADVRFHDPYVPAWVVDDVDIPSTTDWKTDAAEADCAVLLQDHAVYASLANLAPGACVLDTRGSSSAVFVERL